MHAQAAKFAKEPDRERSMGDEPSPPRIPHASTNIFAPLVPFGGNLLFLSFPLLKIPAAFKKSSPSLLFNSRTFA